MTRRDVGILFLLAALWGGSFLFMRVASPVLGPVVLIDMRVLIAGIVLVAYAIALRQRPKLFHKWKAYLVLGALNAAIPFCLIATAELRLNASVAAILNATTPLFTALVARFWIQDHFTIKKFLGVLLGILGVTILVGWNFHHDTPRFWLSMGMSLGAAFFYAVGGVFSSKAFRGENPLNLAIGQQLAAGVILLPVAVFFVPHRMPSADAIWALLGLAVLSTSLGYLLYFYLMRRVGPVRTLSVTFLVPVFGVLWGWWFLREAVTSNLVLGMAVILLSVALVINVPLKWPRPRPASSKQ